MRKSLELKQQADSVYQTAKSILAQCDKEDRQPTATELSDVKSLNAQVEQLMEQSRVREYHENLEAGRPATPVNPAPLDEEKAAKVEKVFPLLGHQLQAVYTASTGKVVGGLNSVEEARNKLFAAASGAGESIDSEGGFLVQRDIASGLDMLMRQTGSILPLLNFVEVSGNGLIERYINETSRATGSRSGAIQSYWVGEGDAITTSKVKFEKRSTDLGKLVGAAYITEELLADAAAITGIYSEAFVDDLTFMAEDAVLNGDGNADKPLGIIGHAATVSVSKVTGQAAATIVNQNISDMWVRLLTGSKSKAVWLINGELGPQLDTLSIPAGTAALEPRFISYDAQGTLRIKGRPVIEVEYCAALGTVGDIVLADFSGYRAIRKGGMNQASSMHVRFLNDEQTFKVTQRIGGQPKLKTTVTPFKGTLTRSYFVTLATRS